MDENVRDALRGVADIPDYCTVACERCGKTLDVKSTKDDLDFHNALMAKGWVDFSDTTDNSLHIYCRECEESTSLADMMGLEGFEGSSAEAVRIMMDRFGMDYARRLIELMIEKLGEDEVSEVLNYREIRLAFKSSLCLGEIVRFNTLAKSQAENTLMDTLYTVAKLVFSSMLRAER